MAGSKRTSLHGFIITAHPDQLRQLRRFDAALLRRVFHEAQDHGQSLVQLAEGMYAIHRLSDHTFRLERHSDEHRSAL